MKINQKTGKNREAFCLENEIMFEISLVAFKGMWYNIG